MNFQYSKLRRPRREGGVKVWGGDLHHLGLKTQGFSARRPVRSGGPADSGSLYGPPVCLEGVARRGPPRVLPGDKSMMSITLKMLTHNKVRLLVAILGIGVAFFLGAAQIGLLVGWCNTNSAIISHADADVWVMAPRTRA